MRGARESPGEVGGPPLLPTTPPSGTRLLAMGGRGGGGHPGGPGPTHAASLRGPRSHGLPPLSAVGCRQVPPPVSAALERRCFSPRPDSPPPAPPTSVNEENPGGRGACRARPASGGCGRGPPLAAASSCPLSAQLPVLPPGPALFPCLGLLSLWAASFPGVSRSLPVSMFVSLYLCPSVSPPCLSSSSSCWLLLKVLCQEWCQHPP